MVTVTRRIVELCKKPAIDWTLDRPWEIYSLESPSVDRRIYCIKRKLFKFITKFGKSLLYATSGDHKEHKINNNSGDPL